MNDLEALIPVGQQIRELRKAKGMSTAAFANTIGRSAGYVNNIERGLSEVSLSVLRHISDALEVQLSWFFQGANTDRPEEAGLVVRQNTRRQLLLSAAGISEELLSPTVTSKVKMICTTIAPGASTGDTLIPAAAEMTGLVLSGELQLQIDDKVLELKAGDSFLIPDNAHRRCTNNGTEESVSIWVITPPIY